MLKLERQVIRTGFGNGADVRTNLAPLNLSDYGFSIVDIRKKRLKAALATQARLGHISFCIHPTHIKCAVFGLYGDVAERLKAAVC